MKATFSPTSGVSEPSNVPKPFDFSPLNRVIFGPGTLACLGGLARELSGERILLVTDPGLEKAGHPQRAVEFLQNAGLAVAVFDDVEENPTTRHVDAGAQAAREHRADFIVAVGGGSAMDVAKGINFLFTNGGSMADYRGIGKATKPMLPSIGVPTTAGTGSEAQSFALIADEKTHVKMACGDRKAAFQVALLDPELTVTQPAMVTAVTGIDSIAHAVESYVCTKANPVSQLFSAEAWRLLSTNFEKVLNEPTNLPARAAMQLGAHLAGSAIEASMLGCAHACANPLTTHYGVTHGVAVGLMLPHVVRFNEAVCRAHYDELQPDLANRVAAYLKAARLPQTLRELKVEKDMLPTLADEATQQWTAQFNPRPVTAGDLLEIYQAACS
jgi:alcohol dehydrogenase